MKTTNPLSLLIRGLRYDNYPIKTTLVEGERVRQKVTVVYTGCDSFQVHRSCSILGLLPKQSYTSDTVKKLLSFYLVPLDLKEIEAIINSKVAVAKWRLNHCLSPLNSFV